MSTDSQSPYLLARHRGKAPAAPEWFSSALARQPERRFFDSQGASIELLLWGEAGKPGLLFLHGNGAHADWWSHIAPFFAEDYRCAALSWSGMGNSARRAEGYTVELLAGEARDAVAAAGLLEGGDKPIAVAHSMGGVIGLMASAEHTPFRALALIDSPLAVDPQQLADFRSGAPRARAQHRPFASLEDGLARFRLSPPQPCANDYIVDHIARRSLRPGDAGWEWHFDARRVTMDAQDTESFAAKNTCPLAFIYGEDSALMTPQTLAMSLAVLPPQAPVIPIPAAQHHVMIDQPLALVDALRELLADWP